MRDQSSRDGVLAFEGGEQAWGLGREAGGEAIEAEDAVHIWRKINLLSRWGIK